MKERDTALSQPFPFWEQLKMPAEDKKMRATDCSNKETEVGVLAGRDSSPSPPSCDPPKR